MVDKVARSINFLSKKFAASTSETASNQDVDTLHALLSACWILVFHERNKTTCVRSSLLSTLATLLPSPKVNEAILHLCLQILWRLTSNRADIQERAARLNFGSSLYRLSQDPGVTVVRRAEAASVLEYLRLHSLPCRKRFEAELNESNFRENMMIMIKDTKSIGVQIYGPVGLPAFLCQKSLKRYLSSLMHPAVDLC